MRADGERQKNDFRMKPSIFPAGTLPPDAPTAKRQQTGPGNGAPHGGFGNSFNKRDCETYVVNAPVGGAGIVSTAIGTIDSKYNTRVGSPGE
jgi:hypothetical protein